MRGSIVWGGILVVLGGLFLLDNLGLLPVHAWDLFWPLLLIAAGAWVLTGASRRIAKPRTSPAQIPLQGATRAQVHVRHGAGVLRARAGTQPDLLATGSLAGMLANARLEGDLLTVHLRPDNDVAGAEQFLRLCILSDT